MILSLIIIALAFYWMLWETDYLRVRLLVGAIPQSELLVYKTWDELRETIGIIPNKQKPFWFKYPENMQPLCGLNWLETTEHIVPEYKIVLISESSKITMRTNSIPVLRDCFRVYRNPYIKVKVLEHTRDWKEPALVTSEA